MKIKTSELVGPALDWAVAKAEGHEAAVAEGTGLIVIRRQGVVDYFDPSTNWGWGGPIIERERLRVNPLRDGTWYAMPEGEFFSGPHDYVGPTPLIAAMRCYVASKFGDEVDVPWAGG